MFIAFQEQTIRHFQTSLKGIADSTYMDENDLRMRIILFLLDIPDRYNAT